MAKAIVRDRVVVAQIESSEWSEVHQAIVCDGFVDKQTQMTYGMKGQQEIISQRMAWHTIN